jgi:molecular chaperone DnaK
LDLDGILHVTAIEKKTGLSKHITITGATRSKTGSEIISSKQQLDRLFAGRVGELPVASEESPGGIAATMIDAPQVSEAPVATGATTDPATALIERCRASMSTMHDDDREEAVNLIESIATAQQANDPAGIEEACKAMSEFLFFIEGR